MRNLVNLKKKEQVELEQRFPCVRELLSVSEQSIYSLIAISVFDHYLTPEEAKIMIMAVHIILNMTKSYILSALLYRKLQLLIQ